MVVASMAYSIQADVTANTVCGKEQFDLVVRVDYDLSLVAPGQFFMLSPGDDFFLGRPLSPARVFASKSEISFLIKAVGKGTRELEKFQPGQKVLLNGPFGTQFPLNEKAPALLIAGGIGVAPLMMLAEVFLKQGTDFHLLYGAGSADYIAYRESLISQYGEKISFATDDGSLGYAGNAVQAAKALDLPFESLYACGPTPLLKAVETVFNKPAQTWLSLEEFMACGFGACNGCAVEATNSACNSSEHVGGGKYLKVCVDGPVIRADSLAW